VGGIAGRAKLTKVVVVVVGTAAVVVVDEVELLVDTSVVAHFVDDEAPH
jgi:hypothetical protein